MKRLLSALLVLAVAAVLTACANTAVAKKRAVGEQAPPRAAPAPRGESGQEVPGGAGQQQPADAPPQPLQRVFK